MNKAEWMRRYESKTDAEKARFWRNFADLMDGPGDGDGDDEPPLTEAEIVKGRAIAARVRRWAAAYEQRARSET